MAQLPKNTIHEQGNLDAATNWTRRWWHFAALAAVLFFVIIGAITILNHEMWRDELRAWQICRDSRMFSEMDSFLIFEGHPRLWYIFLFALSRFTRDPLAMKLLHLGTAVVSVVLVMRFAPITRAMKLLFAFGYFPFFEYCIISRNYAFEFLLVIISCILFFRPKARAAHFATILLLLAQTTIYGIGLAIIFAAAYFIQQLPHLNDHESREKIRHELVPLVLVVAAGCLFTYVSLLPGPPKYFTDYWAKSSAIDHIIKTIAVVTRAWIPVPVIAGNFWNTQILDGFPIVQFILGLILLMAATAFFSARPAAFVFFLLGMGGILLFTGTNFLGFMRHQGQLFLVLFGAFWISQQCRTWYRIPAKFEKALRFLDGQRARFITTIFLFQCIGGITACVESFREQPFSAARQTAEFIRENYGDSSVILFGHIDFCAAAVSGYLDRPIYYPSSHSFGTFNTQDGKKRFKVTLEGCLEQVLFLIKEKRSDVLLIMSKRWRFPEDDAVIISTLPERRNVPVCRISKVKSFDKSIVPDEAMALYIAKGDPSEISRMPFDTINGFPCLTPK